MRTRVRRLPAPLEHQEQRWLIEWADTQRVAYPELRWLVAVPNGAWRHKATAGRLKAEGVRAGYPDLLLDVARGGYHGLRIELKRRQGGRFSPAQLAWRDRLQSQGYAWYGCEGWEEARDVLVGYLGAP